MNCLLNAAGLRCRQTYFCLYLFIDYKDRAFREIPNNLWGKSPA